VSRYSETFKIKMVKRMLSPNARPVLTLSREAGVPEPTLYRWRNAATLGGMASHGSDDKAGMKPPQEWTPEEKFAVVLEAAAIPDAELGGFLRRKGVHEAQLREWRRQALTGLSGHQERKASAEEARRVRELESALKRSERELKRKDQALAETAALLVLKKKAQEIWGDEDDDTDPKTDK
jgi:transposase